MRYRDHELITSPPPAGGITALQIMKTLEQFDVAAMPASGGDFFHTLAEATKRCWQDRMQLLGDPDAVNIPIDEMLSENAASHRAAQIRTGAIASSATALRHHGSHTVNISARDAKGNVVSIHATLGFLFGSTVVVPGLGLVLGHGMSRFDFEPGHPNTPAPLKRMHHNMAPVIALKEGKPVFACGLPGGAKIIPVTARLIANAVDFGMSPGGSVASPRIHVEVDEPVHVSANMPLETVRDLEKRGHTTKLDEKIGGATNVLSIDPQTGLMTGADSLGCDCVAVL